MFDGSPSWKSSSYKRDPPANGSRGPSPAGNLLAEQESTATLRIVQSIALHLGVDPDACRLDADVSLADETDLERLASRIDESVPEVPGLSEAAGARTAPAGSPPP